MSDLDTPDRETRIFGLAVFFARAHHGHNLVFWTAEDGWASTWGVHCRRADQEYVKVYMNDLGPGGIEKTGDWRS